MNLSEHFTLEEMTASETAARKGIDNTPSEKIIANLKITCQNLELVRAILGKPVLINSGYRSPALNAEVGGADNSAHCKGWAADIICPEYGPPYEVASLLKEHLGNYDQLIYEYETWTHVSFDPQMRRQVLSIKHGGSYQPGLVP